MSVPVPEAAPGIRFAKHAAVDALSLIRGPIAVIGGVPGGAMTSTAWSNFTSI